MSQSAFCEESSVPRPPVTPEVPSFRQMLDALPVGAYTCNAEGLITAYNRQAVEVWGREPLLNDPLDRWCGSFRLYSASDGAPLPHEDCWMALAVKSGEPHHDREIIIERPTGHRLTVLAHANPLFDEAGRLVGAMNVLIDISDRKRAEDAQSRLGAIVESSDDAIIGKTLDGRITSWNAGAERLFGYTAEEAVGKPITLIVPPERQAEEREVMARLLRGERVEHTETVRVAKDGTQLHISLTRSPIRDGNGRVIGISKVGRDITARKLDDEALRLLSEMSVRLSTSLDLAFILQETLATATGIQLSGRGCLAVLGSEGQLEIGASLGLDEATLSQFGTSEAGDGTWARCLAERRRVVVGNVEQDPDMVPYRDVARAAGYRAMHAIPLLGRSGAAIGVLATYFPRPHWPSERESKLVELCARHSVDFIENARLYQELREADRAKNDFLATLSHELRNPLAPIRNTVAMLQLTQGRSPELRNGLAVIERQLAQMTRLIDDLLDVSRITRNKLELRRERVFLTDVLRSAIEASRPLLTERGHDFGVDLPPERIELDADHTRLAQVIGNLLHNAAKYTGQRGRIRLAAYRQGTEAVITVRDTGIGIRPEAINRIFEMFAQVDEALDRSEGGLGIGLHLARRLVEMHGGTLTAWSEGPGKGSEFRVSLPLARGAQQAPREERRGPEALLSATGLRILVVDDNRDSADSMGMLLRIPGNEVHIAYDGEHAIAMAEELRPDVVLLDIGLPKLDGYETARQLRDKPWGKDLTLIALTGWGQEEAKQHSRAAGFDAHFVKPVEPAALVRRLAELCRGGPERQS